MFLILIYEIWYRALFWNRTIECVVEVRADGANGNKGIIHFNIYNFVLIIWFKSKIPVKSFSPGFTAFLCFSTEQFLIVNIDKQLLPWWPVLGGLHIKVLSLAS